jgi:uncharacterized membrane protein YebE (DUF533 family)
MFDVRDILDALLRGDPRRQGHGQPQGTDDLSDLLHQLEPADRRTTSPPPPNRPFPADRPQSEDTARHPTPGEVSGMSLEDLLRSLVNGGGARQGQPPPHRDFPADRSRSEDMARHPTPGEVSGMSLEDLLRGLLTGGGNPRKAVGISSAGAGAGPDGAGVLEALRQLLGQAAAGVKEGGARLDAATGASQYSRETIEQMTGKSPDQIIAQLKALIAGNQMGAGAALGALGALILGTQAGRSLAATAAKLGGLALIGGLAFKAFQNYQAGRPVLDGSPAAPSPQHLLPAPEGSGFEASALSNDGARLLIRTMIAAAAADGRIDSDERKRILGSLRSSSTPEQRFFIDEVERPASAAALAAEVSSPPQAVQVYTAARIAVDVDSEGEHAFLASLAERLGLEPGLVAQIDAAARSPWRA